MLARDINDIDYLKDNNEIIKLLIQDKTTGKSIIWATDNYVGKGPAYAEDQPISIRLITGKNANLIRPRISKSKAEQKKRSKDSAEVFTPSWLCNDQNNLVDEAWFERKGVFNTSSVNHSWIINENKIEFPKDKNWKDYVKDIRLEMCCGEAPYLVSRYDTVTGEEIDLKRRIGMLDRKFRIIEENVLNDEEWLEQALIAIKSTYGYELQGDNLFIARSNILLSFIDYYVARFGKDPELKLLKEVINIIAWNIWQMDGLKLVVPYSCHKEELAQMSLFNDMQVEPQECPGCRNDDPTKHNGIRCNIMDWEKNKKVRYDLLWKA